LTAQNYLLFSGLAKFDAQNPAHSTLNNFIVSKERALSDRPADQQLNGEGKSFRPAAQYWKLSEAERANHWTFSRADIETLLTKTAIKSTKAAIEKEEEKFTKLAAARGITLPTKTGTAKPKVVEEEEEIEIPSGKPASPGAPSAARVKPAGTGKDEQQPVNSFAKSFIG
jgi:hypothetical protein